MRIYWFEIVRRTYDRFAWVFVEVRGGRLRVVARSERDWSSKKKARKAVYRLKEVVGDADVVDGTGWMDPFDLPETRFEIGPYSLPLIVGEPPRMGRRGRGRRGRFSNSTGTRARWEARTADRLYAADRAQDADAAESGGASATASATATKKAASRRAPAKTAAKKAAGGTAAKKTARSSPSRRSSGSR